MRSSTAKFSSVLRIMQFPKGKCTVVGVVDANNVYQSIHVLVAIFVINRKLRNEDPTVKRKLIEAKSLKKTICWVQVF